MTGLQNISKYKMSVSHRRKSLFGTRMFKGKRFMLTFPDMKKKDANNITQRLKGAGYNIRIIKTKSGYDVFRSAWKKK